MMAALQLHNRVLLEGIEAHGGRVFNCAGDGICAVFASPACAVDAAVEAQRVLKLPVRMGIASGEAERRRNDYFGTVLNRTARVMAAGHGGQILLDGATAALLGSAAVMSLGPRRLRDIARPVEIFQVRAAGLRIEFPPLKTADPTPGNLTPRTDSFVGRREDLTEVRAALEKHRLVTLTGVGGVGKTRLALEVASRLSQESADEVWVIELASVRDPTAVPGAVAAVLEVAPQPDTSPTASIIAALEGRNLLMVLDNCEHVLDAAASLTEAILTRCSDVRVLATSREGLAVAGEQLWRVDPLDTGPDSAASALFFDRAHAIAPDAASSAEDRAAVVEICRRVDGIPLTIELAASRLVAMTVAELRDRLDDPLRLLAGSCRTAERHRTLRRSLQWSYDGLNESEKSLFARCSVLASGFDLAAVLAVSGMHDEFAVLELLDALVRKSLLRVDRSCSATRYSMLRTVREFAEEQLTPRAEAAEAMAG